MGLAERRAIKAVEDNHYAGFLAKIEEIVGSAIDVEVKWDTLQDPDYVHLYDEAWPKIFFQTVVDGLSNICVDDMGKEAIQEGLKKIVLQNENDVSSGYSAFTFEGGVLTFDHRLCNVDALEERVTKLVEKLEAGL